MNTIEILLKRHTFSKLKHRVSSFGDWRYILYNDITARDEFFTGKYDSSMDYDFDLDQAAIYFETGRLGPIAANLDDLYWMISHQGLPSVVFRPLDDTYNFDPATASRSVLDGQVDSGYCLADRLEYWQDWNGLSPRLFYNRSYNTSQYDHSQNGIVEQPSSSTSIHSFPSSDGQQWYQGTFKVADADGKFDDAQALITKSVRHIPSPPRWFNGRWPWIQRNEFNSSRRHKSFDELC